MNKRDYAHSTDVRQQRSAIELQGEVNGLMQPSPTFSWDSVASALAGRGAEPCRLDEVTNRFKIPSGIMGAESELPGLFKKALWVVSSRGDGCLTAIPKCLWAEYSTLLVSFLISQGCTTSLAQCDYIDTAATIGIDSSMRWTLPSKVTCHLTIGDDRDIYLRVESAFIHILPASKYKAEMKLGSESRIYVPEVLHISPNTNPFLSGPNPTKSAHFGPQTDGDHTCFNVRNMKHSKTKRKAIK